MIRKVFDIPML